MSFADTLNKRIEAKYNERGDSLGWRLLLSPRRVLDGAQVAFISPNPGGTIHHVKFAMPSGSAYTNEVWNSPSQQQVLKLFALINAEPADVLAGYLVPFRSRDWSLLDGKEDALAFGERIWSEIFARSQPKIVIGMGNEVHKSIFRILNVHEIERISLNWGNIDGLRGQFSNGTYIGLPHLSRFRVVDRPASRIGVEKLLKHAKVA